MPEKHVCFVVMPLRPDFHFFYLYIKTHLEQRHPLEVRRGDTDVLNKTVIEKIETEIRTADLIIGEVTYKNPNVYYELGLARAYGKPILFLTQHDPAEAPIDVRPFHFIQYQPDKHNDLLAQLDAAIDNVLGAGFKKMYDLAQEILHNFNADTASAYEAAPIDEFRARARRAERLEGLPDPDHEAAVREFVLPKIVSDPSDIAVIRKLDQWLIANA